MDVSPLAHDIAQKMSTAIYTHVCDVGQVRMTESNCFTYFVSGSRIFKMAATKPEIHVS